MAQSVEIVESDIPANQTIAEYKLGRTPKPHGWQKFKAALRGLFH